MLAITENKWNIKLFKILPTPRETATENIGDVFLNKKFTQCKTSGTLKIGVFEIPHNKNVFTIYTAFLELS